MSVLPGERLVALDSSRIVKYVPDSDNFAFICYLVKQLLTAEDITASALSGVESVKLYDYLWVRWMHPKPKCMNY